MLADRRDPFGSGTENSLLVERIRASIRANGPLNFRNYMALVAHDPHDGYYATTSAIGAAGDFVTSPELHPIFGALIARQVAECWQLLGRPAPFRVVEQ